MIDLPASDIINANGTLTPSGIELRSSTRELLAVAFWVAHTPDNTPAAPIYVRGVHSVASPASKATAHFTNRDAVLIEFDASAAPNFTYSGASIAEAANPLLWLHIKRRLRRWATPTDFFTATSWKHAGLRPCDPPVRRVCHCV
ncbi:hypothetical protein FOA52_010483 [Chlamydomonas sp. UWO 241]|nr:hypothetical protein FOA52_010483 [Chlamydomonas sp. UWO 241]